MFLICNQLSRLIRDSAKNPITTSQFYRFFETKNSQNSDNENDKEKKRREEIQKALVARGAFENIQDKSKSAYLDMVKIFKDRDVHRRNHVEFIYAALKNMENFNVHKDLEVYKALINIMPKGKFIPTNIFQAEFMHYPKQQQCIIDLLEQMEDNGVIPDYEIEEILLNIFGRRGHPVRKFWRMMYWMPKFKNLSPWALPNPIPDESLELARLAVERMCSIDLKSKVEIYESRQVDDAIDDTWIVSGISDSQQELLAKHSVKLPLRIEGPELIWLRNKCIYYFVLRGDSVPRTEIENNEELDDVGHMEIPIMSFTARRMTKKLAVKRTMHEQEDGTIYAVCCTGTSTKDSLLSWIRLLEQNGNPALAQIPVLFKFRSHWPKELIVKNNLDNQTLNDTNAV